MSCQSMQNLLAERALGLLSQGKAARLQAHLEQCETCRQAAADLEQCVHLLAEHMPQAGLPDLAGRVVQKAAATQPAKRRIFLWVPALAAAALLLLTLAWNQFATRTHPSAEEVVASYDADLEALGFWNHSQQGQPDDWDYKVFGIPDVESQQLL